jgi:hypothetical protein
MNDNDWQPNLELTDADLDGCWMTRELAGGWRIHIRLVSNSYKTTIDQLRVEPTESTLLHGLRGHIEVPTGRPESPTWQRINLPTARREASTVLHTALTQEHQANRLRNAAPHDDPPSPDRRESMRRMSALFAGFREFTATSTQLPRRRPRAERPLQLARVAAAYAAAQTDCPTQPREGTYKRLKAIGEHYAPTTIGPLINQARAAGMLTPTQPGKATGRLTTKARRLLAAEKAATPPENPAS